MASATVLPHISLKHSDDESCMGIDWKRDLNCQLDKRRQENETKREREVIQQGLFLNFK